MHIYGKNNQLGQKGIEIRTEYCTAGNIFGRLSSSLFTINE